jgi:hypothetical protein
MGSGKAVSALLLLALASPSDREEEESMSYEIDHFFVAVPAPNAGAEELLEAGFQEGPPVEHPGQGTASRGVFFENVYLELIWLANPSEAVSPLIRRTGLAERLTPGSGACPFGLGLRRLREHEESPPFSTWEYRPPYLPEGSFIPMAGNSENLEEPLLFLLPWSTGPSWEPPSHQNGVGRVTNLKLTLANPSPPSPELSFATEVGLLETEAGDVYLMEVELDGGSRGEVLDLRPGIPLRIEW